MMAPGGRVPRQVAGAAGRKCCPALVRRRRCRIAVALAALGWLSTGAGVLAAAGQPERAAREGLAAYEGGDYAAATAAFATAAELRPGVPELLYDAGISAYQLGDYGAARSLLQTAVNGAPRPELAAAGHLALGNTQVREAEQLGQQDPGAAAQALQGGIASFERALHLAPDHESAAHNLELARLMLDELRRQQPPPPPQQQQGGGQDEQQGQQEQQGDQQPPAAPQQQDQDQEQDAEENPQPAGDDANQPESMPEGDPDSVAREIIAAEQANAEQRRHRESRLQPVQRDW